MPDCKGSRPDSERGLFPRCRADFEEGPAAQIKPGLRLRANLILKRGLLPGAGLILKRSLLSSDCTI
jgi:hypothetical protein